MSEQKNDEKYIIDYSLNNIAGVGKFVLKAQSIDEARASDTERSGAGPENTYLKVSLPEKIEPPPKDEIRELFYSMRSIGKAARSVFYGNLQCESGYGGKYNSGYAGSNRFYDKNIQRERAAVFYKQGIFMRDFEDSYDQKAELHEYFPSYQKMGYEQLRTYFTWRTNVRKGIVAEVSLSYAFLYIYELINNIGVSDPQDGLERLMSFWTAFRVYDGSIDRYILRWLKDYHIYYRLPKSFRAFAEENALTKYYPKMIDDADRFDLFCSVSKYDIRKSAFFTEERKKLIKECFALVTDKIRDILADGGINFDESVFAPDKKKTAWQPFKDALFHIGINQPDAQTVLAENEIYVCSSGKWIFSTSVASESGKRLVGYIMKQTEAELRSIMKYKFKLTASLKTVSHEAVDKLNELGTPIKGIIQDAVREFYREATKTVVLLDSAALLKIRQEAMLTQERLKVDGEDESDEVSEYTSESVNIPALGERADTAEQCRKADAANIWTELKCALSETERRALAIIMPGGYGIRDIKKFADDSGVMLEVLIDGINEKAADIIGDNIIGEDFEIYDDYKDQVKEVAG